MIVQRYKFLIKRKNMLYNIPVLYQIILYFSDFFDGKADFYLHLLSLLKIYVNFCFSAVSYY